jgi:hypothetical protein
MNTLVKPWLICLMLPAAASLVGCQKTEPPPAVVVVPGPPGATGSTGATGDAGKPGTDGAVVVVTPAASAPKN